MEANELARVRRKGAETFPEFVPFPILVTFGAKFEVSLLMGSEEGVGGEALERDPGHEVHLAEAVTLENVRRPAFPFRVVVILKVSLITEIRMA